MKTATVQARIEPQLKKDVEAILAEIGLSSSQAISMYYRSIQHYNGIPFDARIPNKGVQKAIKDARAGRHLHKATNSKSMIADILAER